MQAEEGMEERWREGGGGCFPGPRGHVVHGRRRRHVRACTLPRTPPGRPLLG